MNSLTINTLPNRNSIPGHPFHIVELSPWPLSSSISLIFITINAVGYFYHIHYSQYGLLFGILSLLLTSYLWFRDINSEGTLGGYHTFAVQRSLTLGFYLFVISEIFFFLGIFWAYLHSALSPNVETGVIWPPMGIETIDAFEVPLLNTILLLSSGASLTYSHHALLNNNRKGAILGLIITVVLALTFSGYQALEYIEAPFTIADGTYGSTFYLGTGFHGIHVLIGTAFLMVCLIRIINYSYTNHHHVGFESGALYFHFVDVVWLFLWLLFYYWGS